MSLNPKQQLAFDMVLLKQKSVFIISEAGYGKSYLLNEIYHAAEREGYCVMKVAPTGTAANLPPVGTTVNRSVGMLCGVTHFLPDNLSEPVPWNGVVRSNVDRNASKADPKWGNPRLIIFLDEAGQLSSENARLFYDMGMLYRYRRGILTPPLWVIAADFGQFAPVEGSLLFEPARFEYWESKDKKGVVVKPSILDEIKPEKIELTQAMRQRDPVHLEALQLAREGIALHPEIIDRFYDSPPPGTPRILFNNVEVEKANEAQLRAYAKTNPRAAFHDYEAIGDRLSESQLNSLRPVREKMRVYVGAPFTITMNVSDPDGGRGLLVANGEVVTVTGVLPRAILIQKASGETAALNYVNHNLTLDQYGNKPSFQQLPGYPGAVASLMKSQGQTYDHPVEYCLWQWAKRQTERRSLKNFPGAVYVALSRNTRLEDIYLDNLGGNYEEAIQLLREGLVPHEKIQAFLREGKPPLWRVDIDRRNWVVRLTHVQPEPQLPGQVATFHFRYLNLQTGEGKNYHLRYELSNAHPRYLAGAEFIREQYAVLQSLEALPPSHKPYSSLAYCWKTAYLPDILQAG